MADVYKIKATLDASEVERGAKEVQQHLQNAAAAASSAAPAAPAAQEVAATKLSITALRDKTSAVERLMRETQKLSVQQKASMILGGATAAAGLGGALLKAEGMDPAPVRSLARHKEPRAWERCSRRSGRRPRSSARRRAASPAR